jgi:hypothetical protein
MLQLASLQDIEITERATLRRFFTSVFFYFLKLLFQSDEGNFAEIFQFYNYSAVSRAPLSQDFILC